MTGNTSAECPRCGYDLRGVVASWREQCPTAGACAECGLTFDWREVLNPSHRDPRWSIETQRPVLVWPRQFGVSLLHVFRPRRYWSEMVMTRPIRWRRLTALVAVAAFLIVAGVTLLAAGIAVIDHKDQSAWGAANSQSAALVFGRMLWSPLSSTPLSSYTFTRPSDGRVVVYAGSACRAYTGQVWFESQPYLIATIPSMLFTALAFAALPQSRRRAKVRSRHIIRVALHGLFVPLAVLAVVGLTALILLARHTGESGELWLRVMTLVLIVVGTFFWWQAAIQRYLRMEHSWAVAAATTTIGLLAPIVAYCVLKYGVFA